MISNNKLKVILPCNVYYKNNLPSFYYKSRGYVSLRSLIMTEDFKSDYFKQLINNYMKLTVEVKSYLLDKKYVILDPDLIMFSEDTSSFYFLYLPIASADNNNEFDEFIMKIYSLIINFFPEKQNQLKSIMANVDYCSGGNPNEPEILVADQLQTNNIDKDFLNSDTFNDRINFDDNMNNIAQNDQNVELIYSHEHSEDDYSCFDNKSAQNFKSVFKNSKYNNINANSTININMDTEIFGITLKSVFTIVITQVTLLLLYLIFSVIINELKVTSGYQNYVLGFAEVILLICTYYYIKKIKVRCDSKNTLEDKNKDVDYEEKDFSVEYQNNNIKSENNALSYELTERELIQNCNEFYPVINLTNNEDVNDDIKDDIDLKEFDDINESVESSCKCEINSLAVLYKKNDTSIIKYPINKEKFIISSISKIADLFISPHNNELILTSIQFKYESCFIEDSHSTAGTYLNGKLIIAGMSHKLNNNDDIIISDQHFIFQYH